MESSKLTDIILEGDFDAFQWGWYVEPDPTSMLSYMTCDQLGNWSDSWYCNDEYDALYEQQQTEIDPAARAEQVKQMQEILYEDAPYLVTAYSAIGEAFRSDRFACLRAAAGPRRGLADPVRRLQLPQHAVRPTRPATAAATQSATEATSRADRTSGVSTGVLIGHRRGSGRRGRRSAAS